MKSALKITIVFATVSAVMIMLYRLLWFKTMLEPYRPEWFVLGFGFMLLWSGMFISKQWQKHMGKNPIITHQNTLPQLEHFSSENALSPAEIEVVKLLMEGKNNAEIADTRNVSLNTVKTHLSNVYAKTGIRHRTQLISAIQQNKPHNHS